MIVTTKFPDLPPRPETPANAAFRRQFLERWGRVDSVFVGSACEVEADPLPSPLSFKAVLEGTATARLGRRRIVLGPGDFLLVNPGQTWSFSIRSEKPVRCFSLHVSEPMARRLAADAACGWNEALDGPAAAVDARVAENLRRLEGPIREGLQQLMQLVLQGRDLAEIEAGFVELIADALRQEMHARRSALEALEALPAVRASTRAELARRVGWATDFIHGHFGESIGLTEIAAAAHLSRFHLLRAFRQLHRCSPHQYVQLQRVRAAMRLLDDPSLDLESVATMAGFGSRWTLQRALRTHQGSTGRTLRARRQG